MINNHKTTLIRPVDIDLRNAYNLIMGYKTYIGSKQYMVLIFLMALMLLLNLQGCAHGETDAQRYCKQAKLWADYAVLADPTSANDPQIQYYANLCSGRTYEGR